MPKLQYPEKEQAVVGFLSLKGLDAVAAAASRCLPEDFTDRLLGLMYAAALDVAHSGRKVTGQQVIEKVEGNREWARLAEVEAQRRGAVDWRDVLVAAPDALALSGSGAQVVMEYLGDIAEAAAARRATGIGQRLAAGEVSVGDAVRELQELHRGGSAPGVETHGFEELWKFRPEEDPSTLLGNRWVCKGGQLLLVGQSGIGKSSLTVQAAMTWALGRPFFGIVPKRELRCLFVQAENDTGDMAEIVQGVMTYVVAQSGMEQAGAVAKLKANTVFVRVTAQTGGDFIAVIRDLIRKHGPFDLVFGDPLLSYIGADISQQDVASHFLRQLCNPLAFEHGFAWVWSHHTGKPQSDSKARAHWNSNDFAYVGLGSSELTNWARAIAVLQTTKEDGVFKLLLAKRGVRAGVVDDHRLPVTSIVMQHAAAGLHWEPGKLEPEEDSKPHAGRKSKMGAADIITLKAEYAANKGPAGAFVAAAMKKYGVSKSTVYNAIRE